MPVYKNHTVLNVARGLKAFLSLRVGVTRGQALDIDAIISQNNSLKLQLAQRERQVQQLEARARSEATNRINASHFTKPEKLIWIFGTARVGSTWLAIMLSELENHRMWREPFVGDLFGRLYYQHATENQLNSKDFILGHHRQSWMRSIRQFVLNAVDTIFPELSDDGFLVVKEPNGSIGAPLLMEALPESRMILLVRDPRDAVASALAAGREGSWADRKGNGKTQADTNPDAEVRRIARRYVQYLGNAKEAYENHSGPKVMIKYEDLRSTTLEVLKHACSKLEIPYDTEVLARVVEKQSWENIPEEKKGEGKFRRKATPGGWKEDLTAHQVQMVENITASFLEEFYST